MKKISHLSLIVLLAGTVAACDEKTSEEKKHIGQRDVYNTLEDCVADWGDTELCQQEMKAAREHAEKMAAAQSHSGGGSPIIAPIFWGPTYYGDSRSVSHNGKTITPSTSTATRTANIWNSPSGARTISYSAPPQVVKSPTGVSATIPRGGFGATGASSSSGG